jgi:hypothetical protein
MSTAKNLPEGLKHTESEWNLNYRPAVLYIPEKDPLAEAITDKVSSLKIQLPGASKLYMSIWHSGTQEEFLIHVQNAKSIIYKKGWTDTYNTEEDKVTKSEAVIETCQAVIAGTSTESSMTVQEACTELTKRKASIKQSKILMSDIAAKMFQLYANLLSEELRSHWDKIVTERTASDPWVDIYGDERDGVSGKTHDSFQDCVSFHLQLQLKSDAAETQQCYISTGLKKPSKEPVRQFFLRVERLNGYLATLPCLYFSPQRNATTKLVMPYEDAELADILLHCCLRQWQDQYRLTNQGANLQSTKKLLMVLETIEDSFLMKPTVQPSKGADKSNGYADKSGKRKGTNSSANRIPKKVRKDLKYCQLCNEHGGAHTTHNMLEYRKYNKDGTPKYGGAKKSFSNRKSKANFAQLIKRCAKLEKRLKKASYSNDSSSDSE